MAEAVITSKKRRREKRRDWAPGQCNNVMIRYRVRDEAPSSISSLFLVYEGEGGMFSPPPPCQSAATIKSISSPVSRKQTPPFVIRTTHNISSSCTHSHSHKRRGGVLCQHHKTFPLLRWTSGQRNKSCNGGGMLPSTTGGLQIVLLHNFEKMWKLLHCFFR